MVVDGAVDVTVAVVGDGSIGVPGDDDECDVEITDSVDDCAGWSVILASVVGEPENVVLADDEFDHGVIGDRVDVILAVGNVEFDQRVIGDWVDVILAVGDVEFDQGVIGDWVDVKLEEGNDEFDKGVVVNVELIARVVDDSGVLLDKGL